MLVAGYAVTVTGLTAEEVAGVPKRDHLTAVELDVTSDADVAACIGESEEPECSGALRRHDFARREKIHYRLPDKSSTSISPAPCACAWGRTRCWSNPAARSSTPHRSGLSSAAAWYPACSTASKGGVAQLTKALAWPWAPTIRVNAIPAGLGSKTALTEGTSAPIRALQGDCRSPAAGALGQAGRYRRRGGVHLCSDAAGFIASTVLLMRMAAMARNNAAALSS